MKIISGLLFFLILSVVYMNAHGNLQINQVYTYNGILYQGETSAVRTVPDGKIWKVDHFTTDFLVVNGGRAGNVNSNNGPMWLKAGDTIYYSLSLYGANCCGANTNFLMSIIEFNLVP